MWATSPSCLTSHWKKWWICQRSLTGERMHVLRIAQVSKRSEIKQIVDPVGPLVPSKPWRIAFALPARDRKTSIYPLRMWLLVILWEIWAAMEVSLQQFTPTTRPLELLMAAILVTSPCAILINWSLALIIAPRPNTPTAPEVRLHPDALASALIMEPPGEAANTMELVATVFANRERIASAQMQWCRKSIRMVLSQACSLCIKASCPTSPVFTRLACSSRILCLVDMPSRSWDGALRMELHTGWWPTAGMLIGVIMATSRSREAPTNARLRIQLLMVALWLVCLSFPAQKRWWFEVVWVTAGNPCFFGGPASFAWSRFSLGDHKPMLVDLDIYVPWPMIPERLLVAGAAARRRRKKGSERGKGLERQRSHVTWFVQIAPVEGANWNFCGAFFQHIWMDFATPGAAVWPLGEWRAIGRWTSQSLVESCNYLFPCGSECKP